MVTLESLCEHCFRLGNASGTMGDSSASQNGYFAGFTFRTWMVVVINAFLGQVRNCSSLCSLACCSALMGIAFSLS
jgi:hypothetical protein